MRGFVYSVMELSIMGKPKNRISIKSPAGRKQELTKKCNNCHKVKARTEFYSDSSRHDGLSSECKECELRLRKLRHEKLKNRPLSKIPKISSKRCSKCGEIKPISDFYPAPRNVDAYT